MICIKIKRKEVCNNHYLIGNCCFQVNKGEVAYAVAGLHGFKVFVEQEGRKPEFYVRLYGGKTLPEAGKRLYENKSDGVTYGFYMMPGSGHLLEMRHEDGRELYLWSVPAERSLYLKGDLSAQLLRFALWVGYGLMTVCSSRIAVHGSCIVTHGKAYVFLGESGTGKSTHTRLWREHIPEAVLLNDDSPIVEAGNENIWVYGSPWSGKTPCYKQEKYPLCGCVRLSQANQNKISRLSKLHAYAAFHPSCPPEFAYDNTLYDVMCITIGKVLSRVPFYQLGCLPDEEAAWLSYHTLLENSYEKDSK